MTAVTVRQLLDNGVHFGHQTRRWNPKMKRFIFNERNGIYIIDVRQSLTYIDEASAFVKSIVARGGQVLFVGTKKQAQEAIAEQATRVGMPYVNQRWLGGMLTNFQTISKRTQRLKELENMDLETVQPGGLTKKELLGLKREKDKLALSLGGIKDMARLPQAVWIVDTIKEHLAIDEARKLGIPIVAVLDTNCDPDEVDLPIPGNDDAIRSAGLLTKVIADAVAEGLVARATGNATEVEAEPMPDWERELLVTAPAAPQAAAEGVADVPTEPVVPQPAAESAEVIPEPVVETPVEIIPEVPEEPAPVVEKPAETPTAVAEEPAPEPEPEAEVRDYGTGSYRGENPPEGFDIKGNEDSMKFHTPESPWYAATIAEVWFNSVEAAEAAGFVPAHGDKGVEDAPEA